MMLRYKVLLGVLLLCPVAYHLQVFGQTVWSDFAGHELSQKYYDVKGIRTRSIEAGQGDPVILLHGGGGAAEGHSPNFVSLSQRFRVYMIDMLGHGFTDGREGIDYTVDDLAQHVKDFMDTAGIDKANVVGVSLGGWVAGWFAYKYPDRVSRLVLQSSDGLIDMNETQADNFRLVRQALVNPTLENVTKRWVNLDPSRDTTTVKHMESARLRLAVNLRPSVQKALLAMLDRGMKINYREYLLTPERLRRIKAPALFLWSSNDVTCPAEEARRAATQVPNSEFILVEASGHGIQYEKAAEFNQIVGDFLSK